MSDSENDDLPLAVRRKAPPPKDAPGAAADKGAEAPKAEKPAAAQEKPAAVPAKRAVSDSDDDVPIGARAKHAAGKAGSDAKPDAKAKSDAKPDPKPAAKGADAGAKGGKVQVIDAKPDGKSKASAPRKVKALEGDNRANGKEGAAARVKKEFSLPGQTREAPPENDPLRKFYVSCLQQQPNSEMAKRWLVQYGLLSKEEAEDFLASRKLKSPAKGGRVDSPAPRHRDSPAPRGKEASKSAPASRKRSSLLADEKDRPARRKVKYEEFEDGSEDSGEDFQAAKGGAKKPAGGRNAGRGNGKDAGSKPAAKKVTQKDKAFMDGGLAGSESDDDNVPLAARAKAAAPGKAT